MSDFILPLDIDSLDIISQSIDIKGNIVLTVESKNDKTVCHNGVLFRKVRNFREHAYNPLFRMITET